MAARDPLRALATEYKRENLVLALGAGISAGCGLPTWPQLLQQLAARHLKRPTIDFEELQDYCDNNPAIIAAMVSDRFRSRRAFAEAVRRELYTSGDFAPFYNARFPSAARRFLSFVESRNQTLAAVSALCVRKIDGVYRPNPAIRAVVNFNFDSIFRLYTHYRFGYRILRTIDRASADPRPGRINVYHVHGFLHFLSHMRKDLYESPDLVVLAEQDYFDFFDRSGAIYNYTLRYLLREHSLLFIGLSMKDVNLRRVLHYAIAERIASYRDEGYANPLHSKRDSLIPHFAILNGHGLSVQLRHYAEQDLLRLGVRVLWIESFSEIPERLMKLYGRDWPLANA